MLIFIQYDGTSLGASRPLKYNSAGAKRFLRDILEFQALIGGIICALHPAQYCIMRGALIRAGHPQLKIAEGQTIEDWTLYREILGNWASGFTGLSVISQRETPFHRDGRSPCAMFDVLATFGRTIDPDIRAEFPGIGIRFHYNPGTMLLVLSKAIRHGVSVSKEERCCFAFFVRERILHQLGSRGEEVWMGDELFMAWLELEEFHKVRRLIAIERGNAWEPIGVL